MMNKFKRIYVESSSLNEDHTLKEIKGISLDHQITIDEFENILPKIALSFDAPEEMRCERVVIIFSVFDEDTGKYEDIPRMKWESFEDFRQEYFINKSIPSYRFVDAEWRYQLDYIM